MSTESVGTRPPATPEAGSGRLGPPPWLSAGFLLPAIVLLALLVLYPILYTVWRSLYDAGGSRFIGLDNYVSMFTDSVTFGWTDSAAIGLVVLIVVLTAIGLAVGLTTGTIQRSTAVKIGFVVLPLVAVA